MQVIEIPERSITRYIPHDLSECTKIQYIEVCELLFLWQTNQISYEDFRIDSFYKLMEMKAVNVGKVDIEKHANIYLFSQIIDSFFEVQTDAQIKKNEPKQLKQYYIHNPIPDFIGYFRKYYGPKNEFDDITFGEYLDMLEEFTNFNQTNELIYLNRLLAVGYRPRKLVSKKRVNYNTSKITKRAKQFEGQPIGILWGFYLFFASFNSYLSTCKLYIQGNEVDLSILFSQGNDDKSDIPGMGMKSVLMSIAESGTYGDLEKVRKTNMWEVFTYMYYVTKKNKDTEKESKK